MWGQTDVMWSKREKKIIATIFVCLMTALFAGITVWSINGQFTTVHNFDNGYGSFVTTAPIDPTIQGLLTFLTIGLFFISLFLLISLQIDRLKTKP